MLETKALAILADYQHTMTLPILLHAFFKNNNSLVRQLQLPAILEQLLAIPAYAGMVKHCYLLYLHYVHTEAPPSIFQALCDLIASYPLAQLTDFVMVPTFCPSMLKDSGIADEIINVYELVRAYPPLQQCIAECQSMRTTTSLRSHVLAPTAEKSAHQTEMTAAPSF